MNRQWSPDGKHIVYRGHETWIDGPRNDDGRHARLDDECRRQQSPGNRRSDRQPPGCAAVGAGWQRRVFHGAGAREQSFGAVAGFGWDAGICGGRTPAASAGSRSAKDGTVVYTFTSQHDMSQLYVKNGNVAPRKLTDLNAEILAGKQIGEVESFTPSSATTTNSKWKRFSQSRRE